MKIFILTVLLFLTSSIKQRGSGSIHVDVFQNKDCNLNSNKQLDSARVIVNNYRLDAPIEYTIFNAAKHVEPSLESGKYDVTYINPYGENIIIKDVSVSAERITFVEILLEPNCDLNFFEKRKRKINYSNY
ncbi:MAG: hypothetical protein COA32_09060 [Fluviicola sp.]|nr:MAG: hypothetical protein COA32_09060 [Fluviicola sp.]